LVPTSSSQNAGVASAWRAVSERPAVGDETVVLGTGAHGQRRGRPEQRHRHRHDHPGAAPSQVRDRVGERERHDDPRRRQPHGGDRERAAAAPHEPAGHGGVRRQLAQRDAADRHDDGVAQDDVPARVRPGQEQRAGGEEQRAERRQPARAAAIHQHPEHGRHGGGDEARETEGARQRGTAQLKALRHRREEETEGDDEGAVAEKVRDEGGPDDDPTVEQRPSHRRRFYAGCAWVASRLKFRPSGRRRMPWNRSSGAHDLVCCNFSSSS
jgi:hypothetical protein